MILPDTFTEAAPDEETDNPVNTTSKQPEAGTMRYLYFTPMYQESSLIDIFLLSTHALRRKGWVTV